MEVFEKQDGIAVEGVQDFDLAQTLECGQCFHFVKLDEEEYGLTAYGRLLHVSQKGDTLIFRNTSRKDFETIWRHYFDLDRDYAEIKKFLLARDDKLLEAISAIHGIHILNQEFFETLISFIISQNKQIPHIKQIVSEISKRYGSYAGRLGNQEFYAFPDAEKLSRVDEESIRMCKAGFRAPYICDAAQKVHTGQVSEEALAQKTTEECRETLKQIRGVGDKVANCVILFALSRREAFPVDVWIRRIMETLYFGGETTGIAQIQEFAEKQFGPYGGYAQQYLFYYGKTVKMGVNIKKL